MFTDDLQTEPEIVIAEMPVEEDSLACIGIALGSGRTEGPEPECTEVPLDPSEAEHLAKYLRRLDKLVGATCARIGLSREELRAGAPPKPRREITVDERFAVGDLTHGLVKIAALVGPENEGAILPYAEREILRALEIVGREIDAEELRLWLTPSAQEILRLEDCRDALERLAARNAIRSRNVLLGGGDWFVMFTGVRTLEFHGCGILHRIYAAPYRAPALRR